MAQPVPAKTSEEIEALKRAILFVPCKDKAALKNWIRIFLDLELPDSIVDEDSNCTPLEMVWECYSKMLRNDDPEFKRVLYYAAREAGKTLAEAVIEVLCLVHLGRNVIHLAAIKEQSWKAQEYVRGFLSKPLLREYLMGDNQRELVFLRYQNDATGEALASAQYERLTNAEKNAYTEIRNYVRIIVATLQSTNGQHESVLCLDELDIISNVEAYQEAQMVPSAAKGGKRAVTILTSTRKFSFGIVQDEINRAAETGLLIRHWNILDVTEACPASRHKPELPRLTVYRSQELLKHVSPSKYEGLTEDQKLKYVKDTEVFAGCGTCKLYPMCKGRLATHQKSKISDSSFVKEIDHVISQFQIVSLPKAKAQLLCWKPSTEGLIYPQFDRDIHMLTPSEMAEKITGDPYHKNLSKRDLIQVMKKWELRWGAGMDFGFSHCFAVVAGATDGYRAYVVHVISEPGLDPTEQVEICKREIKPLDPSVYPDPENPQMIATLRKSPPRGAALRMKPWAKGPGTVIGGIDVVRMLMRPAIGEPRLFFLKDDEKCEELAKRIASYHWKLNPDGTIGKVPDETDDDSLDAMRYWLMNEFAPKGAVKAAREESKEAPNQLEEAGRKLFRDIFTENGVSDNNPTLTNSHETKGSRGSIKWDMG